LDLFVGILLDVKYHFIISILRKITKDFLNKEFVISHQLKDKSKKIATFVFYLSTNHGLQYPKRKIKDAEVRQVCAEVAAAGEVFA